MTTAAPARTFDLVDSPPVRPPDRPTGHGRRVATAVALVGWAAAIVGARWWAESLEAAGHHLVLYTPPILGGDRVGGRPRLVVPALVAAGMIVALPPLTARLRWRRALVVGFVSSLVWWLALAAIDGGQGLVGGLAWDAELGALAPSVGRAPGTFLSHFTSDLGSYGIYVRSHPPGVPLLFGGLDRLGLGGEAWATACVLLVAASGVVGVLLAIREIAGERWARAALPFVVLAPSATWIATSFDAVFMGVGAWVIALLAMAGRRSGRRTDGLAIAAGIVAAIGALLSYGLALLAIAAVLVAISTRRVRPICVAAITAATTMAALVPLGFSWIDGWRGTKEQYFEFGLDRPVWYFVVGNLGAWALALGPATVVGVTRLRDRRMWVVVGGGLLAALVADVSGLTNGEVERIWLPFTLLVVPAGAALVTSTRAVRGWLVVQTLSALSLAWFVVPRW